MREKTATSLRLPIRPYILFVLILAVITAGIWWRFWTGLSDFESGRPENAVSRFVSELEAAGSEEEMFALLKASGYDPHFESAEYGSKSLLEVAKGEHLTYSKKSGWQGKGEYAYSLLAGGEEIAVIELVPTGKRLVMGLTTYKAGGVYGVETCKIIAPAEAEVKVGDSILGSAELAEDGIVPDALKKLSEFEGRKISVPSYVGYEVDGLIGKPQVSAKLPGGEEYMIVEVDEGEYSVGYRLSEELKKEIEERITTITKKYSYYMSDDLGWTGFRGYIVYDSPLYDRLRTLEVYWYTLHDRTEFKDMSIDEMFGYSEGLVSVRMTYDYVVYGQGKITVYPTDLTYYLALDLDGKWRVAEMVVN